MKAELFFYCLLCLVLIIDGALARGTPSRISPQTPYHHHRHHHAMDDAHHDPSSSLKHMIFFRYRDLKPGKSIPLYLPTKNLSKTPQFLPREESDSLPFSLRDVPFLLRFFNFTPSSPQSKSIEETLAHCESPPIRGESKFCATSLETMLDGVRARFGSDFDPKLFTTSWIEDPDTNSGLRRYTVVGDPIEIVGAPDVVACHPMPYPFAVFYCHGQSKGQNKLFDVEMERGGERTGVRVRVIAMCHMDTSDWNPGHVGFRLLGVAPGEAPVCHIFPPDDLVWIPVPASSSLSS